jgi:hypothetical protein
MGFIVGQCAVHYVPQKTAAPARRQKSPALQNRIQVFSDFAFGNALMRPQVLRPSHSSGRLV